VVKSGELWDAVERRLCRRTIGNWRGVEQMFLGNYEHTIDEKGRITIPVKYREELGDVAVVTKGYDGNLQVIPQEVFDLMVERVRSLNVLDPSTRRLRRILFANAERIEFDKAGRILLPAFLRDTANLKDAAVLVGNLDVVEIWSPENWLTQQTSLSDIEANEQRLSTLDLTTLP
jgi:MraZ protein